MSEHTRVLPARGSQGRNRTLLAPELSGPITRYRFDITLRISGETIFFLV
ncbi:hypothetical protein [Pseudonocardia xinjiangensis]|uniref:Uncharacterized protein n=1 Tax=Pseudonocardia xinjiangensis TaxID=75289 RepID=A0ABX1R5Y2_9PSEU|nr:hypothetical protein [Pseudonocardia xinjiangensis]NMH75808.1 hypothetical protein [Pseudonocardia xinjiangensis]